MDSGQAELAIAAGTMLIGASFFTKNFYAAKGIRAASLSNKPIPTWMGRLIFWVVGGFMILVGVGYFVGGY